MDSAIPQQPSQLPSGEGAQLLERHRWRRNDDDIRKWAELFKSGITILRIANQHKVDPETISRELHRLGFTITPGHHMVEQLPLRYPKEFTELVDKGPDHFVDFVGRRVWGINATEKGLRQVRSFCEFFQFHHNGVGVEEIARRLSAHRSTIARWREGTDQPYLIRAAKDTLKINLKPEWKLLPMHLTSGGNEASGWIQVPVNIRSYGDILGVIDQTHPLEIAYKRALQFALGQNQVQAMRYEFFGYLLGMMVGDSGKLGGEQPRYSSMNLDLQLTLKQPTNERLGEFVMMCANSLGIQMERKRNKQPTGATAMGEHPSAAYRWTSERSPLLAWMFSVGLGLTWQQTTTTHPLRMDWILDTPESFRKRFVQGAADSDGCVKNYVVEIASVPNSEFFVRVLQSLGMTTAHLGYEGGEPLKTRLNCRQASTLPIFNEFVKSYRYQKMTSPNRASDTPAFSRSYR